MIHIFFDVDGVLIDGFHARPERRNRWDKNLENDLGISPDKLQGIFTGFFLDVLHGRADFEQELAAWLKNNGYDVKAAALIDYWHSNDSNINRDLYPLVETLSAMDDVSLYIATNQTHERAQYLWNELGFKSHFKNIYYSARLGCLKSDTHYFAQIETDLRLDPRRDSLLYFDDDPRNIAVASARGWTSVLFDTAKDANDHPDILRLLNGMKGD